MLLAFFPGVVTASGEFLFTESSTFIRITGHSDPVGELAVPAEINGKPVTEIDYQAFKDCVGLTSITLPDSLRTISHAAFWGCTALVRVAMPQSVTATRNNAFQYCSSLREFDLPAELSSLGTNVLVGCGKLAHVTIPSGITRIPWGTFYGCAGLRKVVIPNTVTAIDLNGFYQCHGLVEVDLPEGLTSIGDGAFYQCSGIAHLSIPSSVTSIGPRAFERCSLLTHAFFQGNAPSISTNVFHMAAPEFAVYFFDGADGFSEPTWEGYPAVNMGAPTTVARWLTTHGNPHDVSLLDDGNHDGVSLLMAYALGLDPNQNLAGAMPRPAAEADAMSISYYAAAEGVTYVVEASRDMMSWSPAEVSTSDPEPEGHRTATIPVDASPRYLRLKVSY